MLRTRWLVSSFSALLLGLLIVSCSGGATAALAGTAWTLETLSTQPPLTNTTITLTFENGTVGGSSGCNSYSGKFTATATDLAFTNLSSTEMACEAPIMEQEAIYLAALGSDVSYLRTTEHLTLTNGESGRVLVFVSSAP